MKKIRSLCGRINTPSRKLGRSQHDRQSTYFNAIRNTSTTASEKWLEAHMLTPSEIDDYLSNHSENFVVDEKNGVIGTVRTIKDFLLNRYVDGFKYQP
jgi:hypothetical protein